MAVAAEGAAATEEVAGTKRKLASHHAVAEAATAFTEVIKTHKQLLLSLASAAESADWSALAALCGRQHVNER